MEEKTNLNNYTAEDIESAILNAVDNNGVLYDQWHLSHLKPLQFYYEANSFAPVWSDTALFLSHSKHFMRYLDTCISDGLLKNEYHYSDLNQLVETLSTDSIKMKDAVLWAKTDILFTDAFMHVIADLKQGRLVDDSLLYKNLPDRWPTFFQQQLTKYVAPNRPDTFFRSLQPKWNGYGLLKDKIADFYKRMDTASFTYVHFPFEKENTEDSLEFISSLTERLNQDATLKLALPEQPDSATLSEAIIKYQKRHGLEPDGKVGKQVIQRLNLTDKVKLKRLFITLDRYKLMPDSIPDVYIWVNIPSFNLQAWQGDSIAVTSRVVCGKPVTPTPIISSEVYDMVTYPTWTVPASIIKKEMLPGLKKSSGYLSRKGLDLYNNKGEKVDPHSVDWSKYKKGIPYQIKQGSGDNNALGVIKFNFRNPHDVYLHDTNQRNFFKNSNRALSHGCVRVQEWLPLAQYLIRNDSLALALNGDSLNYTPDSVSNWIEAKKKQRIPLKKRVPIFINYFSCAAIDDQLVFYTDIYEEDKKLMEKYFSN